jgi:hypothetical protein
MQRTHRSSPIPEPRHQEPWSSLSQAELLAHVSRPYDGLPSPPSGLEKILELQASPDWSARVADAFDAAWNTRLDEVYVRHRYTEAAHLLARHRPAMIERCLDQAARSSREQKTFQERGADIRLLQVVFAYGTEDQATRAFQSLGAWADCEATAESAGAYARGLRDHLASRYPDTERRAARFAEGLQAAGPVGLPFTGSQLVFSRLRFEATEQPDGLLWATVMATGRQPAIRQTGTRPWMQPDQMPQHAEGLLTGRSIDESLWERAEHLVRWCGALSVRDPAVIRDCPPLLAALTMGALTGELPGKRGQCRPEDREAMATILGKLSG